MYFALIYSSFYSDEVALHSQFEDSYKMECSTWGVPIVSSGQSIEGMTVPLVNACAFSQNEFILLLFTWSNSMFSNCRFLQGAILLHANLIASLVAVVPVMFW